MQSIHVELVLTHPVVPDVFLIAELFYGVLTKGDSEEQQLWEDKV